MSNAINYLKGLLDGLLEHLHRLDFLFRHVCYFDGL